MRVRPFARIAAAAEALSHGIRRDHATMTRLHAKYGAPSTERALGRAHDDREIRLARDLVEKVGFQMMVAYRVMRFLSAIEATLASRVACRLIRHVYGSEIHWSADIAPGVMVVHGMGMAISHSARIETDVLLFQNCTLGEGRHPDTREVGAPTVQAGAVIGAGAVLLGPITIGARSKVMPGCVVLRSVPSDSIVEASRPHIHARPRARATVRVRAREDFQ